MALEGNEGDGNTKGNDCNPGRSCSKGMIALGLFEKNSENEDDGWAAEAAV